ncbi:MAG TPA: hypothetical protein DCY07_02700 [Rhodospirillaceae bacterium]|nr:hypothetical protein [Rhodospirillaceae bacterium]
MFELSQDRRVPKEIGPKDTYVEFTLHCAVPQSPPWKDQKYCYLKLEGEGDFINRVREAGLEMNGKTQSPFPRFSVSYARVFTPMDGEDAATKCPAISEENATNFIYFGQVLPLSKKEPNKDHLISIPAAGIMTDKSWFVLTRTGISFDLVKSDVVVGASLLKRHEALEGEILYERGALSSKMLNLVCGR